jgi:hypothetical protein
MLGVQEVPGSNPGVPTDLPETASLENYPSQPGNQPSQPSSWDIWELAVRPIVIREWVTG